MPNPAKAAPLSQLERIRELHRLIRRFSQNPRNETFQVPPEVLVEKLGVSDRQIRRDLDVLARLIDERDVKAQLAAGEPALLFDHQLDSYRYTRDVDLSDWVGRLSDEDLGALVVAEQALAVFRGMPLARRVGEIFAGDAGGLIGNTRSQLRDDITALVSFHPEGAAKIDRVHFETIFRALLLSQALRVNYRSRGKTTSTERILHPYHLCCFKGQWRLIAFDSAHHAERDFVVTPRRMLSVELLSDTFTRPAGFNAETARQRLNRHGGNPTQRVTIRVSPVGAHHVLEREWDTLRACTELKDGSVDAIFEVGDTGEFMRFVLSFGSDCEVLDPPAFREAIREEARKVFERI